MITNIVGLLKKAEDEIRLFTDRAVIGLSGGADSTLVACLCVRALGPDKVHGYHMPYNQLDKDTFNTSSRILSYHLKINSEIIEISAPVDALLYQFGGIHNISVINQGNIRSRMRMISLYGACKSIEEETGDRTRVIGTDNFSENFLAYFTKFGDGGVDYSPIISLFKSEVYQLLEHFRDQNMITEDMINRCPSAGLFDGQTDEGELGFSYDDIEISIKKHINGEEMTTSCDVMVKNMHLRNMHKNNMPPSLALREFCD